MLSKLRNQLGIELVGGAAHCIGKSQSALIGEVKHLGPSIGVFQRIELHLAYPSSPRRGNMSGESSRALVDNRGAQEDKLFARCWYGLVVGP